MYILNFILRETLCDSKAEDYRSENVKTVKTFPFKLLSSCIFQRVINLCGEVWCFKGVIEDI